MVGGRLGPRFALKPSFADAVQSANSTMTRNTRIVAVSLFLLASLHSAACHSSDNVDWVFISNPSGTPNNPNSGGGTIIVVKSSQAWQQTASGAQSAEGDLEKVLPQFLDRFLAATRTAIHSHADLSNLQEILLAQALVALRDDVWTEDQRSLTSTANRSYELPVLSLLERLEALPMDSELPGYEQAMWTAASLRMGLATTDVLLSLEEPSSPLYAMEPVPLDSRSTVSFAGEERGERGAAPREEFLQAARVQIRAAYQDYLAARSGSVAGDAEFMDWVEEFVQDLSL